MCSSQPGGISAAIKKFAGVSPVGGKAILSSGAMEVAGPVSGVGLTKSMLRGQRRKAARLPKIPILGASGEEVDGPTR